MRKNNLIIDNAKLVLADEVIDGYIVAKDGIITEIAAGRTATAGAIDAHGSYVFPGFIEVHTDYMDKCFTPRPKTQWPASSAMNMHDGVMALAGITTVCDAVAIGYALDGGDRAENVQRIVDAIVAGEANHTNRIQHFLHLRCELNSATTVGLFEHFADVKQVRLVSLMDHAPGQRQFVSLEKFRDYYKGKYNLSDTQMAEFEREQIELSEKWSAKNRKAIVQQCHAKDIALATHDDATLAHIEEALAYGCTISEFPTTIEAAKASHENNMRVVMGAPNVVRGGSHSGNIAAHDLAAMGILDILSSDYYPSSLVDAVFTLAQRQDNALNLVDAAKMISKTPAEVLHLNDRGELAVGKRADLAIVTMHNDAPRVEHTYVQGRRIN